jgi:hypothetical protein
MRERAGLFLSVARIFCNVITGKNVLNKTPPIPVVIKLRDQKQDNKSQNSLFNCFHIFLSFPSGWAGDPTAASRWWALSSGAVSRPL